MPPKIDPRAIAELLRELASLAADVASAIIPIMRDDAVALGKFTQEYCDRLLNAHPEKNVMIVADGVNHNRSFVNEVGVHVTCPLWGGRSWGYQAFYFDYGTFDLLADGGFRNWCFNGNYVRNKSHVDFSPMPANPTLPPLPTPNRPPPTIPAPISDTVFLVNSEKDGVWTSGIAWYAGNGAPTGTLPGAYVDIKTDGTVKWEGQTSAGKFDDGNVFWASIQANAHDESVPLYSQVGVGANLFHEFKVFKDKWRVIYEVDGWKVYVLYYCQ